MSLNERLIGSYLKECRRLQNCKVGSEIYCDETNASCFGVGTILLSAIA